MTRHGFRQREADAAAADIAPFIEQALLFHEASTNTTLRVRPLLQYYAYLNLAVSVVLIYRPKNWQGYRSHGAKDLTHRLNRISLSSAVVKVTTGTLTLMNDVISDGNLPKRPLTLRDLLAAVPMVVSEPKSAFRVSPNPLTVKGALHAVGDPPNQKYVSQFDLRISNFHQPSGSAKFPLGRVIGAHPRLSEEFTRSKVSPSHYRVRSKQAWSAGNRDRAAQFHEAIMLQICNFGAQRLSSMLGARPTVSYEWYVHPETAILPTISAGLLLAFVMASLARYRANIMDRMENSKINLLHEVFSNECDGFMIPAFRNLLYGECMYVASMNYT